MYYWIYTIFYGSLIFLYGIVIGSFLNVCIFRIPRKEDIVKTGSHCMTCNHKLAWYDLVPLFSFLFLRGRCRYCKTKLSIQYPLVEALNGVLYVVICLVYGLTVESLLYCLLTSALIALSVIDFRTYEISVGFNVFILALGLVRLALDYGHWYSYVIGLFSVSLVLAILYYASKGRAIGGGDVKLMAAAGLLLGWKLIVFAFLFGCVAGAIIHLIRMKLTKADHVLAMGPYLSAGIVVAVIWGDRIINWYFSTMF